MADKPRKKLSVGDIEYAEVSANGNISLVSLATWYLIFKALDGDKVAEDLLNSAGIIAYDIHGVQMWPIVEQEN